MDSLPITARSFEDDYHIDGDGFERAYKEHLSGYREWPELEHADQWLLYPENIGPHVSIDETCLSTGEVYTIVTNKAAHGRKGCIIAVVRGTKAKVVTEALKKMPESLRMRGGIRGLQITSGCKPEGTHERKKLLGTDICFVACFILPLQKVKT